MLPQYSYQKQQTKHTIDGSFIIFFPKKTTIAPIVEYYHAVAEASFFQENAPHDINLNNEGGQTTFWHSTPQKGWAPFVSCPFFLVGCSALSSG